MNLEQYDNLTTKEKVEYFEALNASQKKYKNPTCGIGIDDRLKPNSLEFKKEGILPPQ